MTVHADNQAQADFWTTAGQMWTAARDRFDEQVGEHGSAAMDALAVEPGQHVIDVGCGAGSTTVELAARVGPDGSVLGLDISPSMIEGAAAFAEERAVRNASFSVEDAMAATFDAAADAMYSRFGVMFFSDAVAGFANMRTALKPGGRLGFVCWQSPASNPWASVPLSVAADYVEMPFGTDPTAPGPFSLGDLERLGAVLDDAGYADVAIDGRSATVPLGRDLDAATDFIFQLMPPVAAMRAEDPAKARQFSDALAGEFAPWARGDGVHVPSATWIVTAVAP